MKVTHVALHRKTGRFYQEVTETNNIRNACQFAERDEDVCDHANYIWLKLITSDNIALDTRAKGYVYVGSDGRYVKNLKGVHVSFTDNLQAAQLFGETHKTLLSLKAGSYRETTLQV